MRVAVIGGSGLIGNAILIELAGTGHEIHNLDISVSQVSDTLTRSTFFDLTDTPLDENFLASYDVVVLAAGDLDKACRAHPQKAWRLNVVGAADLVRALSVSGRCPMLLFISSGMVYNADALEPPFGETAPTLGSSLYTASKLCIENAIQAAADAGLLRGAVVRPFTVFGAGPMSGDRGHLIGRWADLAEKDRPLTIYGDGSQVVDLVPVATVARLCRVLIETKNSKTPFRIVNATAGTPTTLSEIAACFKEVNRNVRVVHEPISSNGQRRGWGDASLMRQLLGRDFGVAPPKEALEEYLRRRFIGMENSNR
jgi:UDP-glucose 4-epimerase